MTKNATVEQKWGKMHCVIYSGSAVIKLSNVTGTSLRYHRK